MDRGSFPQRYTQAEFEALVEKEYEDQAGAVLLQIKAWIDRGDGAAVYRNDDLGSPMVGEIKIVSFGSSAAQIETAEPPTLLPDIGNQINWRYRLFGTYNKEDI